ncbi:cysteine--tRNA ligase [Pirellulaceae bacterium]|nr:cysteine--tRNA ligase [Pirellulaceae bacterium]
MTTTLTDPQSMTDTTKEFPTIRIFNTLTRVKEEFVPVEAGKVGMYLCGPTVYKEAHIGHMVGPVIFDTVKRYLSYCGYDVNWVVNITDVDDKLIAESNRRGISMSQVATEMTADYSANLLELGVNQISSMPKATENMDEIIDFIEELIEKDFAYAADGDVFFDVLKDSEYGKLTNRSPEDQQGEGGNAAGKKRSAADFALWKSAKPNEPAWESPWGKGRPGWHIECSAMSRRILGKTFDIHGGGLDLTFPHHENEIAQSECCHDAPMAKYWMHNGLMKASKGAGKLGGKADREASSAAEIEEATVDTKISRSKGAGGLRDLIAKQTGERIRFFLLRTHYRSTIEFGDEGLEEAGVAIGKFYTFFDRYERIVGQSFYPLKDGDEHRTFCTKISDGKIEAGNSDFLKSVAEVRNNFIAAMNNDFDTNGGMSELFGLLSALNKFADSQKLEEKEKRTDEDVAAFCRATETLRELSSILGIFQKPVRQSDGGIDEQVIDSVMQLVIQLRNDARANKNWDVADKIRDGLNSAGVELEDRKGETGWKIS